jgi:hypothetical protein
MSRDRAAEYKRTRNARKYFLVCDVSRSAAEKNTQRYSIMATLKGCILIYIIGRYYHIRKYPSGFMNARYGNKHKVKAIDYTKYKL